MQTGVVVVVVMVVVVFKSNVPDCVVKRRKQGSFYGGVDDAEGRGDDSWELPTSGCL